jgi:hypothetical protein
MLETFRNNGCNMSLKLHFLHSRLDPPRSKHRDVSGLHGNGHFAKISITENATMEHGVQQCLPTTAGKLKEKIQLHKKTYL